MHMEYRIKEVEYSDGRVEYYPEVSVNGSLFTKTLVIKSVCYSMEEARHVILKLKHMVSNITNNSITRETIHAQ